MQGQLYVQIRNCSVVLALTLRHDGDNQLDLNNDLNSDPEDQAESTVVTGSNQETMTIMDMVTQWMKTLTC
jgi:hypothetical protein